MNLASIRRKLNDLERAPVRDPEPITEQQLAAQAAAICDAASRPEGDGYARRCAARLTQILDRCRARTEFL